MAFAVSQIPPAWRWAALLAGSAAAVALLGLANISAAQLIGPMAAAIALAVLGAPVRVPAVAFEAAQAIVGLMIARTMTLSLFAEVGHSWPLFVFAVGSLLVAACALGWMMTRWQVLPGTAPLWGTFPGAATAMVLMAESYGADIRLVAFMQYLRVVIVALVASVVAQAFDVAPAAAAAPAVPAVQWGWLAATLAVAGGAGTLGRVLPVRAGALLVPMVAGAVLQGLGLLQIELPPPLLACAYAIVGWSIGLRFTGDILRHVARSVLRVVGAILALIAGCGLFAVALVVWGGIDPLTAYLAMSPGGADSVAIIAASSHRVDLPFVMALQMTRFLVVLALGPGLARFIARCVGTASAATVERPAE